MSIVRPFRGLRPRPEIAGKVAALPYDVLSSEEARVLAEGNPYSFYRVNKAEICFPPGADPYAPEVYQAGRDNLQKMISDGLLIRDERPCLYLYRITWQGRSQTGLVSLCSVDEYDADKIKKHEHTRPEKVNDRAKHIMALEAQVGPVFSTFRARPEITAIFTGVTSGRPEEDFVAEDGVRHELWVIRDQQQLDKIVAAFAKVDYLYIADGHHRSQSASEACKRLRAQTPGYTGQEIFNFFLNVLFADEELRILPYNRVVKDQNGLPAFGLVEMAQRSFDVTEVAEAFEPTEPHVFGMYVGHKWYRFTAKPGTFDANDPVESIDAAILAKNYLAPVLGIKDQRTDKRIDFVGGIRGVKELVKLVESGDYKVAFSLHATSIKQLLKVADAGQVMPPKSTWFEPKLRSGMVVNLLKD